MTSRYNDPKKLYVIYRDDTHEYLSDIWFNPDSNSDEKYSQIEYWGVFAEVKLFDDLTDIEFVKSKLQTPAKILEIEITKWACKEPIEGR